MAIRETLADWIDTIGALEAINLTLFTILILGGTIAILWARSRAKQVERQWHEQGAKAFQRAAARMEDINSALSREAKDIRGHGHRILQRVRKDTGRRY